MQHLRGSPCCSVSALIFILYGGAAFLRRLIRHNTMPYKSERIKIAGTHLDKRRRLTNDQINAIKLLKEDGYSYRQLAAMFGCSKWSIQNIIHPQIRKLSKKKPTEYWTEKKREYRKRKQALYKSGMIIEKPNKRKRTR